jgi:ubiquinone biosynthesis protein COQ4
MTALSLVAVVRLKPAERERFFSTYLPWAVRNGVQAEEVLNVYWEEELETDVDVLRSRLGIEKPPDLREIRKKLREQKRAEKAEREAVGNSNPTGGV